MQCRPPCHGYASFARTFGTRPCSLQNRALAQDILKKSSFIVHFRSKNMGDFAFKAVLLERSYPNWPRPALPCETSSKFRVRFLNIHKLRSRARQIDFCDVLIIFISSKISSRAEHPRSFVDSSSSKWIK